VWPEPVIAQVMMTFWEPAIALAILARCGDRFENVHNMNHMFSS